MGNINTDKLIETLENCFQVINEQNKVIANNNIEIESLKLKLIKKPKVEIKLLQNDKYRENITKLFVKLESEQKLKDSIIDDLKNTIELKDKEINRLNYYNKCKEIFSNGGIMV